MYNPVSFSKKDPQQFFKTLSARVNAYFTENNISKSANLTMYVKTLVMFAAFFVPYGLIVSGVAVGWALFLGYFIMGLGEAGIGLCIMHDANHGAYSRYKWVNTLLSYTMNLIGGSSFTWKVQHNHLHHTYTNIYHLDEDIDDKPFLRLSPHGKLRPYHRFQHIYAFFLYCLATVSWVIQKDFRQLARYNKDGLTKESGFNPTKETIEMIVSKLIYFGYMLVLPIVLGVPWAQVLLGILLMQVVAGFIITVVFQLAHVVEGPEHIDGQPNGDIENTWAIHQLHTTADFATQNKVITWLVGGLNFQVEHHLFPNICHVHYPEVSKIVKNTVAEFGLPYHEFPRFFQAVDSHVQTLKKFGNAVS